MTAPIGLLWLCACAAMAVAFWSGGAEADTEAVPPGEGRIALTLAGGAAVPQRHVRYWGSGAICENASWDGGDFFGEVGHCEAVGDRYWRRGAIDIDLLLARFAFLTDFLVAPPQPYREIDSRIGPLTLYAFELEDVPGQISGCNGFVRGYDANGTGYHAYLIGYACADRRALDDARADALLRGLSVRGAFSSLLP